MANRKFTLSSATKQKLNWLKAQWVNETCRNLQAKVIKTANRGFLPQPCTSRSLSG